MDINPEIKPADGRFTLFDALRMAGVAAFFFIVTAPMLSWLEFSNGIENLNVATALEIRRTNNWAMPTLAGQSRVAKPPLTAWITASLLSQRMLDEIASADPAVRDPAYKELNWQTRWPMLLIACLTAAAVYELGRLVGGWRVGLAAAFIYGTMFAFLRHSRRSSTDIQLSLWVTLANVFLGHAILCGRRWVGFVGAGVVLGLAFMSKGPVALVQTVAPAIAFVSWNSFGARKTDAARGKWNVRPILVGFALFVLIAMPWFVVVTIKLNARGENVFATWYREVSRDKATDLPPDSLFSYVSIFAMVFPWVVFFASGVLVACVESWKARRCAADGTDASRWLTFVLFFLVTPILIMSCFPDRKERYLLPMMGPAAVLAAVGWREWARRIAQPRQIEQMQTWVHRAIVASVGIGLPILGMTSWVKSLTTVDGRPWFTMSAGIGLALAAIAITVTDLVFNRRNKWATIITTVAIMLLVNVELTAGYRNTNEGRSEMRPFANVIRERFPDAEVYSVRPGRRSPEEFAIYLARTVTPVLDASTVKPSRRTRVVVICQEYQEPAPTPPAGWNLLATWKEGRKMWHAYYLLPVGI